MKACPPLEDLSASGGFTRIWRVMKGKDKSFLSCRRASTNNKIGVQYVPFCGTYYTLIWHLSMGLNRYKFDTIKYKGVGTTSNDIINN